MLVVFSKASEADTTATLQLNVCVCLSVYKRTFVSMYWMCVCV